MESDLDFPNRLERPELASGRRKLLKYGAAGIGGLLLLTIVLLPQLFSSRIGRNIVKMYLESHCRGQAWVTELQTSWLGPTRVYKFSLTDPEGRQVKFTELKASMGLWGLLSRRLNLGTAEVTDLHVDYVVDYGDGTCSLDRSPDDRENVNAAPTVRARMAPVGLPQISGRLTLKNATLVLTRGVIYNDKQLRTAYRSARLGKIEGTVTIARSLDEPWSCELRGTVGSGDEPGTFRLAGTLDLGAKGLLDPLRATADVTFEASNVPNEATEQTAPLTWVLLPLMQAEDCGTVLGKTVATMRIQLTAGNGEVRFGTYEAQGQASGGRTQARVVARPVIDLRSTPATMGVSGPAEITVGLTKQLARDLAPINPFLMDLAEGAGVVRLRIDEMAMPLTPSRRKMSAKGTLSVSEAALQSGHVALTDQRPRELVTQWQALTGDLNAAVRMEAPATRFTVSRGLVTVQTESLRLNNEPVTLSGTTAPNGELSLTMSTGHSAPVAARIGGTLSEPRVELPVGGVAGEAVQRNITALRERGSERLWRLSQQQVQDLVGSVDRINQPPVNPQP